MEVNISHRSRQEILTTADLAHSDLFNNALNELLQLMKMVGDFLGLCSFTGFIWISITSEYVFLFPHSRTWQKITGHPCSS